MPIKPFVTSKPTSSITQLPEQGVEKQDFINYFKQYYVHLLGRDESHQSPFYADEALSLAIRDHLMEHWKALTKPIKTMIADAVIICPWSF